MAAFFEFLDILFSVLSCLKQDYTAKLSDFGLAKAGPQGDETHVSTRVMGTYGYAAPEYVMTGMASGLANCGLSRCPSC